jgi:hypothetical protein
MTDTGGPHLRSAQRTGAWLTLDIRREIRDYPVTVHVQAQVDSETDESISALHDHVKFETKQKKRLVRFELSESQPVNIEPVVPIPETAEPPELELTAGPEELEIQVLISSASSDKEYDSVSLELERTENGYEIVEIYD